MNQNASLVFALLLGLLPSVVHAATPAEQMQALAKDFNSEGFALRQCKTDEEREQVVARVEKLTARLMELAAQNPKQPIAMDALVQVVTQEMWMENNTPHQGKEADSPAIKAIATLLRDHARSEKAGECRTAFGKSARLSCAWSWNRARTAMSAAWPACGWRSS